VEGNLDDRGRCIGSIPAQRRVHPSFAAFSQLLTIDSAALIFAEAVLEHTVEPIEAEMLRAA
jgi:hypothetical protein